MGCTSLLLHMQAHRARRSASARGLRYRPTFEHPGEERGASSQQRALALQSVSKLTSLHARPAASGTLYRSAPTPQDTRACFAVKGRGGMTYAVRHAATLSKRSLRRRVGPAPTAPHTPISACQTPAERVGGGIVSRRNGMHAGMRMSGSKHVQCASCRRPRMPPAWLRKPLNYRLYPRLHARNSR